MNKGRCIQGLAVIATILLLVLLSGCADDQGSASDSNFTTFEAFAPRSGNVTVNPESVDASALVQANNMLAVQLFQFTNSGVENTSDATNGVVAGYGLSQALAMVALGARGTTAAEFPSGLDASADPTVWSEELYALNQQVGAGTGYALHNAVWGQQGYRFLSDYLNMLERDFEADLTAYAFKPLPQSGINSGSVPMAPPVPAYIYPSTGSYWSALDDWMAQVTASNTLSTYSVPQNDPQRTRLAFANTTILATDWPMVLMPADSFEGLFETFEGIQYWVPMLRQQGVFGFYQDALLSAMELPLGAGEQSLLLITPSAGNYEAVFNNLAQHLNALDGLLVPTEMETFIPEFSFSDGGELDGFLGSLGFDEVYWDDYPGCIENCGPDFSGINGQGFLRLEAVTRRSALSFSSEAISGGSVTAAVMEATTNEPDTLCCLGPGGGGGGFVVNGGAATYFPEGLADAKPFIFVIRDTRTGAVLYLGQLTDAGGTQAGSWSIGGGGGGGGGSSGGGGPSPAGDGGGGSPAGGGGGSAPAGDPTPLP